MKILITGACGYIGSHTTKYLLDNGITVVGIDNLSTGHIEAIDQRATFYQEDIGNYEEIVKILQKEKVDGVIHFAAYSLVEESTKDPFKYYENNLSKTNHFLKALVDCNVLYLVFSSSASVYGEPKSLPLTEENDKNPASVYGNTKLMMEKMISDYYKAYNLKYVALRYFNVAGAYPDGSIGEAHNPETHLIPLVILTALKKRDVIKIYGNDYDTKDGTCIRDYIHIIDLADAHLKAIEYLFNGGKSDVFNLGSGNGFSVLEIIDAAKKIVGDDFQIEITERRNGDPAVSYASSIKAKSILKWNPQHESIEEMINDAYRFLRNKKY